MVNISQKVKILAISAITAIIVSVVIIFIVKWFQKPDRIGQGILCPKIEIRTDLLIKGCLFELGITKENTSFTGNNITVLSQRTYTESEIRSAFGTLNKIGSVNVIDSEHIQVTINVTTWDIIFHGIQKKPARIAIIVDDMGLDMTVVKQLCSINADLTFSILPMCPYSKNVAKYAHGKGKEVMLHLPMEGNGIDPGKDALHVNMSASEISAIVLKDIKDVPYISGVNNHMGSKVTQEKDIMVSIFNELKKKNLFYIDSMTTNKSICEEVAKDIGIPFGARKVFLDNEHTYPYIKGQLDKLVSFSKIYNEAIGICHPTPVTIKVLTQEIPSLQQQGIEIVRVSAFVKRP